MKWNRKPRRLISRAIKHWNTYQKVDADAWHKMSKRLIGQFLEIVQLGITEYEYDPPKKYFNDEFNLCKQMMQSPDDYILFLRNPNVPPI